MELLTIRGLTVLAQLPSARSRAPILFIHGYLAAAWVFEPFLHYFAERGHACYAVNLRGRNGSRPGTNVGAVSVREFADDARFIAEELGSPIVVGHSMGGLVAQLLAAEGRSRGTILLAPAPPRGIPVVSMRALPRELRYMPAIMRSRLVVARWSDFRPLVLNGVPLEAQRAMFERLVPDSGRAARDMLLGAVAVDERQVRSPMLVVGGSEDRFIPLRAIRRVAEKYGARLVVAPERGHMLPVEPGWEKLAADIGAWIDANVEPPEASPSCTRRG